MTQCNLQKSWDAPIKEDCGAMDLVSDLTFS